MHGFSKNTDYTFRRKQWLQEGISMLVILRTYIAYMEYIASLCSVLSKTVKLYWAQHRC
jgi:hypothetical protein